MEPTVIEVRVAVSVFAVQFDDVPYFTVAVDCDVSVAQLTAADDPTRSVRYGYRRS